LIFSLIHAHGFRQIQTAFVENDRARNRRVRRRVAVEKKQNEIADADFIAACEFYFRAFRNRHAVDGSAVQAHQIADEKIFAAPLDDAVAARNRGVVKLHVARRNAPDEIFRRVERKNRAFIFAGNYREFCHR
jgi:hypothetical protein